MQAIARGALAGLAYDALSSAAQSGQHASVRKSAFQKLGCENACSAALETEDVSPLLQLLLNGLSAEDRELQTAAQAFLKGLLMEVKPIALTGAEVPDAGEQHRVIQEACGMVALLTKFDGCAEQGNAFADVSCQRSTVAAGPVTASLAMRCISNCSVAFCASS